MTVDAEAIDTSAAGASATLRHRLEKVAASALAGWRLPALIVLATALVRFLRLGDPDVVIPLDETYYAPNSLGYACHGADMTFENAESPQTCDGLAPTFAVHPPLGKLLIAAGIKIFGYTPFGWRAASAAFGTLAVLVVYLIGRRLWDSRWLAAAGAVLVSVDGLFFVQSRLAMLDIFLAFFVLLGVWLLLEHRARYLGGIGWWRVGAGVALGLAAATKWVAAPVLGVAFAVALAWEISRLRDNARRRVVSDPLMFHPEADGELGYLQPLPDVQPERVRLAWPLIGLLLTMAVMPVVVYVASYTPWFLSTKRYIPPRCNTVVNGVSEPKDGLSLWLCNQKEIFDYHRNLKARDADGKPIHPYMSQAWSWPWISRPAAHYFVSTCQPGGKPPPCEGGAVVRNSEILGLPNPLTWWVGSFIALPACLFWMLRKRDDVAALLVVMYAPLVLPWFATSRPLFMFYMTPAVPFLALMIVHVMHRWEWGGTGLAFVVLAVTVFAYFYPVLAAYPLPPGGAFGWESRIWFGHGFPGDCTSAGIKLLCWI